MISKDFKYSVENFRGIAIIFVMLSHLSSFSTLGSAGRYLQFIVLDATTWFVFISGYLFSYIEKKPRFKYIDYILKKIKFVITPYLILSIPAILAGLYFQSNTLLDLNVAEYFFWSLSVGGSVVAPMWFIPMIAIFFILSFIFNSIKGLALLASTIFLLTLSIFSFRTYMNLNPFLGFSHFVGFYFFGLIAHALGSKITKLSNLATSVILSVSFLVFLTLLLSFGANFTPHISYISFNENLGVFNPMQLGKLALLIFVFFSLEKFYNKYSKILSYLAKISFGLFFIHGFYMLIFSRYFSSALPNNYFKLFVELILVIPGSILTVYVLKIILRTRSKYVIGC